MITFSPADQKLLQNSGVDGLILFGSQAQGIANSASDFDILVIGRKKANTYDVIYDLLSGKINQLVDVDIVFATDAPVELKNHVVKYGQVLYQTTPSTFPDFKAQTMLESADFAPYRQMFNQATISRISLWPRKNLKKTSLLNESMA